MASRMVSGFMGLILKTSSMALSALGQCVAILYDLRSRSVFSISSTALFSHGFWVLRTVSLG